MIGRFDRETIECGHTMDEHSFRRGIINRGFTVRRVQDHEPFLRHTVTKLIDSVCERGECDVVKDIATPLPMAMIGELMGLPEADHDQLLDAVAPVP